MYIYIYTYIYVYTYIYIQLFYCYSIPNAFFSKLSLYNNTVHTVDNMPTVVCFLAQYIVIICGERGVGRGGVGRWKWGDGSGEKGVGRLECREKVV